MSGSTGFFGDKPDAEPEAAPAQRPAPSRKGMPLAERMRPLAFEDWIGHEDLVGQDSFLSRILKTDTLPSLIFWGPPGCGKTTLAGLIARRTDHAFVTISAVTTGIKEAKALIEQARGRLELRGRRTILFIDEIHRFNKAQQDAFLPHVETGIVTLFGATTENPSFSIISALLSRSRVIEIQPHSESEVVDILRRALVDKERGLGELGIEAEDATLEAIAGASDGDARRSLNLLEQCAAATTKDKDGTPRIDTPLLEEVTRRTHLHYDKTGDQHFNLISALHKSLRASDPQGALYWTARMLASGEDPLYVARRMVRFANEDIGLADPQAMPQALAAVESYKMLGSPEGDLALAQAAVYLATAPKSNSLYAAWNDAQAEVQRSGSLPVPLNFRNAPTKLMKESGYGEGYRYDHDCPDHFAGQSGLPENLKQRNFYVPGELGFEKEIAKRIDWWNKRRDEIAKKSKKKK